MKFAAFENVVNGLYQYVVPKTKAECNKTEQLGVSFAAGYIAGPHLVPRVCAPQATIPCCERQKLPQLRIVSRARCSAGILCAVVSQPADNMVSMLSANPKATMNSVIADMGMANLATRGLPLRILMVGTLTGLQWGIYDAYKVRTGCCAGGCCSKSRRLTTDHLALPALRWLRWSAHALRTRSSGTAPTSVGFILDWCNNPQRSSTSDQKQSALCAGILWPAYLWRWPATAPEVGGTAYNLSAADV